MLHLGGLAQPDLGFSRLAMSGTQVGGLDCFGCGLDCFGCGLDCFGCGLDWIGEMRKIQQGAKQKAAQSAQEHVVASVEVPVEPLAPADPEPSPEPERPLPAMLPTRLGSRPRITQLASSCLEAGGKEGEPFFPVAQWGPFFSSFFLGKGSPLNSTDKKRDALFSGFLRGRFGAASTNKVPGGLGFSRFVLVG